MTPAVMNAVLMQDPGGPEVLRTAARPVPRPGTGQVLVRTQAAVVSPVDLSIRSGALAVDLPFLPGTDASGEVLLVGPKVTEWSPGDRVVAISDSMGRTRAGGYADYLLVDATELHSIPDNVSFICGANVGRDFSTAWAALFHDARLGMNERVVVVGAAHPIGIAAVQICHWKGARVIAVSDGRHAQRLTALGANRVISHSAPNLARHVRAGFEGRGATVVINVVDSALPSSVEMLERDGRLVLPGGGDPQLSEVEKLIEPPTSVVGGTTEVDPVDIQHVFKLLGEATLLPVVDSIHPLSEAAAGHRRAEYETTFGAVLLVPDQLHELPHEVCELLEED